MYLRFFGGGPSASGLGLGFGPGFPLGFGPGLALGFGPGLDAEGLDAGDGLVAEG